MKTSDIFKTTSSKLNESLEKTFGKKIKFETFTVEQLEDARNKLRTQVHQVRSSSSFNENVENDAFYEAQWMLDAINAELAEREEQVVEGTVDPDEVEELLKRFDKDAMEYNAYGNPDTKAVVAALEQGDIDAAMEEIDYLGPDGDEPRSGFDNLLQDLEDDFMVIAGIEDENDDFDFRQEYDDDRMDDMMDSVENTDEMIAEGEVEQASAIVTANTMVDRVGRWIEELSGMENETMLQLGDSIRDEFGQDQSRTFIETASPAIQQALEVLKTTRETIANSVRVLSGEEQPQGMLGAEEVPAEDEMAAAPEDAMNAEAPAEEVPAEDEFATAEPAVGGEEAAGREQRESIDRSHNLLRTLAG